MSMDNDTWESVLPHSLSKSTAWPPYGLLSDLGTQISKSAAVVITVYCTHFGTPRIATEQLYETPI